MQAGGSSGISWGFASGVLQQLVNAVTAHISFPLFGLPDIPPGDIFDPQGDDAKAGAAAVERALSMVGLATRRHSQAGDATSRPLLAVAEVRVAQASPTTSLSIDATVGGADWGSPGRECALVSVYVDGGYHSTVQLFSERPGPTLVNLGELAPGPHRIEVRSATDLMLAGAPTPRNVRLATISPIGDAALIARHAPVLELRDPPEHDPRHHVTHTDAPLLLVPEVRANGDGTRTIDYRVMFTNEDGGTPIRTLYRRYGRGIDYELAYSVVVDAQGRRLRATYQGPLHRMHPFTGSFEGDRPLLRVATANNNFSQSVSAPGTAERWSPTPTAPVAPNSADGDVLRLHPWVYPLMGKELVREQRAVLGPAAPGLHQIADPRSYLYLAPIADAAKAALMVAGAVEVVLSNGSRVRLPVQLDFRKDGGRGTALQLPAGIADSVVAVSVLGIGQGALRAVVLTGSYAPRELDVRAA